MKQEREETRLAKTTPGGYDETVEGTGVMKNVHLKSTLRRRES